METTPEQIPIRKSGELRIRTFERDEDLQAALDEERVAITKQFFKDALKQARETH